MFTVASLFGLFWHEIFLNVLLIEIYVSITDKDPPLCIFMLVDAFRLTNKYNHVVWHPGVFSRYETKSTFSNSVDTPYWYQIHFVRIAVV